MLNMEMLLNEMLLNENDTWKAVHRQELQFTSLVLISSESVVPSHIGCLRITSVSHQSQTTYPPDMF